MSKSIGSSEIDFAIRRTPIAKFTYFGKVFDFDGGDYEIDNMHRVFGKSGQEIAKNYAYVKLCHAGIKKNFDKVRLYHAVVNPLLPNIEAASGIRVVNKNLPDTDCAKFAWETPQDRANRVELNRYANNRRENEWRVLAYADETFETFERFEYEVNSWTGDIRNERTKRILKPSGSKGQVRLCRKDGTFAMILVYRAYMCTFKVYARETDQTHVDHVDGNHLNNDPANLRWASPSENERYKFNERRTSGTTMTERKELQKFTGNLDTLKQFRDSGWYMGLDKGTDEYVIVRSSTNDKYRVGDFNVTSRSPYPLIGVGNSMYKVHRVVAFVEGIISKDEFENPKTCGFVVMHVSGDKEDFRPENLKRGTPGDNQVARHENPETSGRKAVRQLDLNRVCMKEFPSITAAALNTGIPRRTIHRAIKYRKYQGNFHFEFVV
jgi:hypothetical protein